MIVGLRNHMTNCALFKVIGGMEPDGEANDKDFTSSNANKNRISKNLENKEFNKFDVASRTHTNSAPSIVSSVGPSIKSTEVPTAMRRLSYGYIVSDCAHISCTAHYSSGNALICLKYANNFKPLTH